MISPYQSVTKTDGSFMILVQLPYSCQAILGNCRKFYVHLSQNVKPK